MKGNISKPPCTKGKAEQTDNNEIEDSADTEKDNAATSEAMLREVVSNQMTIEDNLDETTDEEMLTEISANMTKELLDLFGTEMEEDANANNTGPEINLEERAAAATEGSAIKRKRLLPPWMSLGDSNAKV